MRLPARCLIANLYSVYDESDAHDKQCRNQPKAEAEDYRPLANGTNKIILGFR